jgi:hypothetical protein
VGPRFWPTTTLLIEFEPVPVFGIHTLFTNFLLLFYIYLKQKHKKNQTFDPFEKNINDKHISLNL